MTIFYFTSTGNSLAVAKRIGGTLISIPQIVDAPEPLYRDDAIGVIFPIYGFSTPRIVRAFLNKVKLEADYLFAIGTYGNMPGAAMVNVQKQAQRNGYRFDYANHLLMVDNFLPIFEMDAEAKKLPAKKVEEKTAKIVADINSRKHIQAQAALPFRALTTILEAVMPSSSKNAQKYLVNDKCIKCGICAKVCPAKNINITDKVNFSLQCEGCLACIHLCPQNALHLKNQRSGKRWRNPDVTLNEIIGANNRGQEK